MSRGQFFTGHSVDRWSFAPQKFGCQNILIFTGDVAAV